MSKIFFDANVLLDILIPDRPNHAQAVKAYIMICDTYDTLATSENILTTIEYIAAKNGIDCMIVWKFFKTLKENFALYHFSEILDSGIAQYQKACEMKEKIDFEDVLQLETAIFHQCDAFLTEDKGIHALQPQIKILSLYDF